MNCETCCYNTDIKCNFIKHVSSKKHKEKVNSDKKSCNTCFKKFATVGNTNRHMKSCKINYNNHQTGSNNISIIGDNNNIENNININNLNINMPSLETVSEEYRKYFMMTIPELIEKSISDFVSKEMNKQLLYEKCDFMQFDYDFTSDILLYHSLKYGTNSCRDCVRKNGTNDRNDDIINYCKDHRLSQRDAVRILIKTLTDSHKKNICITSLKKYDNDDGELLIKHKDLMFSLGILHSYLEKCRHVNLINFDNDCEIEQKDVIDLYEAFFKKFEKNVIANKNRFNSR